MNLKFTSTTSLSDVVIRFPSNLRPYIASICKLKFRQIFTTFSGILNLRKSFIWKSLAKEISHNEHNTLFNKSPSNSLIFFSSKAYEKRGKIIYLI